MFILHDLRRVSNWWPLVRLGTREALRFKVGDPSCRWSSFTVTSWQRSRSLLTLHNHPAQYFQKHPLFQHLETLAIERWCGGQDVSLLEMPRCTAPWCQSSPITPLKLLTRLPFPCTTWLSVYCSASALCWSSKILDDYFCYPRFSMLLRSSCSPRLSVWVGMCLLGGWISVPFKVSPSWTFCFLRLRPSTAMEDGKGLHLNRNSHLKLCTVGWNVGQLLHSCIAFA